MFREWLFSAGIGGEGGIRTHGTLARTAVFKTAALNHSATSPAGLNGMGHQSYPRTDTTYRLSPVNRHVAFRDLTTP